jgi:hypothetical protein
MKYPVDILELVNFFEKLERFFHVLSNTVGSIFDPSDEFKPQFQPGHANFFRWIYR